MQIRYPWLVWVVIGFNAALCFFLAMALQSPFKFVFYFIAAIAALQAIGFATANVKLEKDYLKVRHFFRSEVIPKWQVKQVDATNFRTVLLVLNTGATKQLPAFGLDSFRTAKTIRSWLIEE